MKGEEAPHVGKSFFGQGTVWFLLTGLLVLAARNGHGAAQGTEVYAGVIVLAAFALATLIILLLSRMKLFIRIYGILVYFALLYGIFFYLTLVWPLPAAVLMVPLSAMLLVFSPRVVTQNAVLAVALAGVALQFSALLSFSESLVLLVLLAIYDIVAVNVTKHMVAMARAVVQVHLPVIFIIPFRVRDVAQHVRRFEPGSNAVFLGAGDVALPAVLIATAPNSHIALGVLIGCITGFGVLVVTFLRSREPHPLPALPFLLAGAILGISAAIFFG